MLRVRQILVPVQDLVVYLRLLFPAFLLLPGRILRSISWSNLLLNQLLLLIDTLEHLTIYLSLIDDICRAHDDTLQMCVLLCVRLKLQQTLLTICESRMDPIEEVSFCVSELCSLLLGWRQGCKGLTAPSVLGELSWIDRGIVLHAQGLVT